MDQMIKRMPLVYKFAFALMFVVIVIIAVYFIDHKYHYPTLELKRNHLILELGDKIKPLDYINVTKIGFDDEVKYESDTIDFKSKKVLGVGNYAIHYQCRKTIADLEITIKDTKGPVMKLKKPISLFVNERVNYNHNIEVSDYSHYEMRVDDSKVKYDTPGTYEVLATAVDDYRNQSELKIPVTIKEADLTLSETNISMEIGQTKQLQANTESTSVITYSSSDENVAKISRDGMITAVGKGTCIISASVNGKRVQCYVTVTDISDTVVTPTPPTENETDEHQ
jgi:hypothetical protein